MKKKPIKKIKHRTDKEPVPPTNEKIELYRNAFGGETLTSRQLAERLGYSAMGIRESLVKFVNAGYISIEGLAPRGSTRGRPERLWRWKDVG